MTKLTGFRDTSYQVIFFGSFLWVRYSALLFCFLWKGLRLRWKAAAVVGQHCAAAAAAIHLHGQLVGCRVDYSLCCPSAVVEYPVCDAMRHFVWRFNFEL